jgi:hypothetical protein
LLQTVRVLRVIRHVCALKVADFRFLVFSVALLSFFSVF